MRCVESEIEIFERRFLAAGVPHAETSVRQSNDRLAGDIVRFPWWLGIGAEHRVLRMLVPLYAIQADGKSNRSRLSVLLWYFGCR